ncbi:MAG: hypothetical protein IJ752_00320 [Alphaproteobacteria bacterium]|nr:hypothetical protein [Alphaproteobacteria bacterium]
MLKIVPFSLSLCLLAATVHAEELSPQQVMQAEFEQNKAKIDEIFQDKIQKISARSALPDDMRNLLISQADEIRQFDLNMLEKKMEMKLRQAKQRDELKEHLRQDAQNRAKWILEDEENFQKNKEKREETEQAVLNEVEKIQQTQKETKKAEQTVLNEAEKKLK